jgi:hypothetical protein
MDKYSVMITVLAALLLTACGADKGRFRMEGRLRHMNQAELLVYSPDGAIEGLDTIMVKEGRFAYEAEVRSSATFILIFPNYSEQPVFAESGTVVTIKGDASHMKEMTINGTDDNDDMTKLRMELNRLMPPEIPKAVSRFIREKPASPVSLYLLQRYIVTGPQSDLRLANELIGIMSKANPDNGQIIRLKKQLAVVANGAVKTKLPKFTATGLKGEKVTENMLKSKVNVVTAWATWNYTSNDMQRRLKSLKSKYGDQLSIVSICVDGNPKECRKSVVERDSLKWPTVCDGKMWQTPMMLKLGIATVPANIVINQQGIITDRNLTPQKLEERINNMMK